jgi:nicotinate dehydrogenase subunit A
MAPSGEPDRSGWSRRECGATGFSVPSERRIARSQLRAGNATALRNDLGLLGTRFGCGEGTCGACNVLLDDHCVHSCDTPVSVVGDREVTTVEGLGSASEPGALAEAFDREQAGQCGYCLSGILATTTALLRRVPRPDESQVRVALDGNLCRCGSHNRIVRAVLAAAADSRDVSASGELG